MTLTTPPQTPILSTPQAPTGDPSTVPNIPTTYTATNGKTILTTPWAVMRAEYTDASVAEREIPKRISAHDVWVSSDRMTNDEQVWEFRVNLPDMTSIGVHVHTHKGELWFAPPSSTFDGDNLLQWGACLRTIVKYAREVTA